MEDKRTQTLKRIAKEPKGSKRRELLKDESIRQAVLSSGANVTLYCGKPHRGTTAKEALSDVFIGLIQRKNKKGKLDGLGALGGLAERTAEDYFNNLTELERVSLIGKKDDVILEGMHPILTKDINIIRRNNVIRELSEELEDLGITDISINPEKLELIPMPKVKDDNYMINIWDGKGECYAISPYCHIYEDKQGVIEEISRRAAEKEGGEAVTYKKMPLFEALSAYGHLGNKEQSLEDGRSADKDYRYPHEYLAAWALAAKLFKYKPERMVALAEEVQESADHEISFARVAEATDQSLKDIAKILQLSDETLEKMQKTMQQVYIKKIKTQPSHQNLR